MSKVFLLLTVLFLVVPSTVLALGDIKAQLPWPNPSYSQAPFALDSASKVLRFRGTLGAGEIDMSGAEIVCITPSTNDLTRHFNTADTKTFLIPAGPSPTCIGIVPTVNTLTITGTDTTIYVEGM